MLKSLLASLLVLGLSSSAALAAGGGAKTTTEEPAAASDPWTAKWGDLGPDYAAAEALVKSEKFAEAITALEALPKQDDPRIINYLAFSHRKLGATDKAIELYTKALSIAPEFTLAREYLGEAYIQLKDLAKAKEQLAEIEKLCGNQDCEEYKDLAEDLKKAEGGAS
jgi:tetratricopeptide (TPR) repeat protein